MTQILIDIPDFLYKQILKKHVSKATIARAFQNGVVLPKGHGRLIDAEAFQKSYCESNCGNRKCVDAMDECIFIGDLQLAPTIIEADKEDKKSENR